METIFYEITQQQNVRSNLSVLRKELKNEDKRQDIIHFVETEVNVFYSFLEAEDAKTRKNAALLLGDVGMQASMEHLWSSYQKEKTLFVKSAYLTALDALDVSVLLPCLKERQMQLEAENPEEENRKHLEEEKRALRKIIIRYEGINRHTFVDTGSEREVLLICNRTHREIVKRSLGVASAKLHPLGVLLQTDNIASLWKVRSFREVVFPIHTKALLPMEPKEAARLLWDSDLMEQLSGMHAQKGAFYFRVECRSSMTLEERSVFAKKLAAGLERLSGGMLINSTTDYEIEIRLYGNRDGKLFPCLKCHTLKDIRFEYRKNAIAASIHPSTAALLVELAAPYLKENAQIMDPFCGVGTMLIERAIHTGAREMYATDIFGEAIEMGRENAALAKQRINFIHRDFFDFKHEYLFDEIITNMPVRGKRTKEEMDTFYSRFFEKAQEILSSDATIIMYTNEIGFVKKQLRLHPQFRLLQESSIQTKNDFYLLVIGLKR